MPSSYIGYAVNFGHEEVKKTVAESHPDHIKEWVAQQNTLRDKRLKAGCFYEGTNNKFCGFCADCRGDYS